MFYELITGTRIEYIFFSWQLTRKNLIVKNLKRLRKQIEREHGKLAALKYPFVKKDLSSSFQVCFLVSLSKLLVNSFVFSNTYFNSLIRSN